MIDHKNPQLKRGLSETVLIFWGLPVKVFALAALFSGFGLFLLISQLGWMWGALLGGIFSVMVFAPLRWIHKEDAHAWILWIEAFSNSGYTSTRFIKKRLFVMRRGNVLHFKQWKKDHE
ncbi:hypothetical protein QWZ04_23390 [Vibrio tapetis subsp. quintayensis]|uniref:hypothetical protein n=1 Tax=Vibrio tapetis TaxID=52443 RepID=UPI0025B38E62|nr:hypothetical protein [Vibrio tapetis]MDN3683249.1 hypothetical protein [Vibrio tapetis subsp. quintayensis]